MERLTAKDCPVRFHFARLSELGNSADDIFITMNARGKQLTAWEHFKAQFLPWLRETYPDCADDITRKLDNDWLDVFWSGFPAGRTVKIRRTPPTSAWPAFSTLPRACSCPARTPQKATCSPV